MPLIDYSIINAFVPSDKSAETSGNPAAVIVLPAPSDLPGTVSEQSVSSLFPPDEALWTTAKELDLPMTSFLIPLGASTFALRWFYAGGEAPLCGHGTVAAAFYLFQQGHKSPLEFITPKARLYSEKTANGMTISLPASTEFSSCSQEVKQVFGRCFDGGQAKLVDIKTTGVYSMIELESTVDLSNLQIDEGLLDKAKLDAPNLRIFQITPKSNDPSAPHVQSRILNCFPNGGYLEDSATGSAHGAIVPYVLTHRLDDLVSAHPSLRSTAIKDLDLKIRQCSLRGGEMVARWLQDEGMVRLDARAALIRKGRVNL